MPMAHDSVAWAVAWHPAGHMLASGGGDAVVKFWCRPRQGDPWADRDAYLDEPAPGATVASSAVGPVAVPGLGPGVIPGVGEGKAEAAVSALGTREVVVVFTTHDLLQRWVRGRCSCRCVDGPGDPHVAAAWRRRRMPTATCTVQGAGTALATAHGMWMSGVTGVSRHRACCAGGHGRRWGGGEEGGGGGACGGD